MLPDAGSLRAFLTRRADRLNPMLVRELRQITRSNRYFATFVGVQVAMILYTVTTVATDVDGGSAGRGDNSFWVLLSIYLYGVMPFSGFFSFGREYRENRMDLLLISNLTPMKILFGKWQAMIVQSGLIAVSLLPYVSLRYFCYSTNPFVDIGYLLVMLAVSAVTTGCTVFLSGIRRIGERIGAILIAIMLSAFTVPASVGIVTSIAEIPVLGVIAGILPGILVLVMLFNMAANSMSPQSVYQQYNWTHLEPEVRKQENVAS